MTRLLNEKFQVPWPGFPQTPKLGFPKALPMTINTKDLFRSSADVNSASEDEFREIYFRLKNEGTRCSPRGQPVIEVENFTYELSPYVRFPNFVARKYSEMYVKNELLWYLRANKQDKTIVKHAKMWAELVNDDGIVNSNYGHYVFGQTGTRWFEANWQNQFDNVIKTLTDDKDSRRASIMILNSSHLFMVTKDVPCTYSMNFRIRDNKLNMSVHMRSQDAMFGMGNDAPAFSMFQEMIYIVLRDTTYPELQLGAYHHICDSFHVYERHFEMLEQIISGDKFQPIVCPKISNIDEVRHLRGTVHLEYRDGKQALTYPFVQEANNHLEKAMHLIPNIASSIERTQSTFEFSRWLLEGAHAAEEKEDYQKEPT